MSPPRKRMAPNAFAAIVAISLAVFCSVQPAAPHPIGGSPAEQPDSFVDDELVLRPVFTEFIEDNDFDPPMIRCFCNLPACLEASGGVQTCTTTLGCFAEALSDVKDSSSMPSPTTSKTTIAGEPIPWEFDDAMAARDFVDEKALQAKYGCLEQMPAAPGVNKECNKTSWKLTEEQSKSLKTQSLIKLDDSLIRAYYCCKNNMCNDMIHVMAETQAAQEESKALLRSTRSIDDVSTTVTASPVVTATESSHPALAPSPADKPTSENEVVDSVEGVQLVFPSKPSVAVQFVYAVKGTTENDTQTNNHEDAVPADAIAQTKDDVKDAIMMNDAVFENAVSTTTTAASVKESDSDSILNGVMTVLETGPVESVAPVTNVENKDDAKNVSTLEATTTKASTTTVRENDSDNVLTGIMSASENINTENVVTDTTVAKTENVVKDAMPTDVSAMESTNIATTVINDNDSDNTLGGVMTILETGPVESAVPVMNEKKDVVEDAMPMNVTELQVTTTATISTMTTSTVSENSSDVVLAEVMTVMETGPIDSVVPAVTAEKKDIAEDVMQMNVTTSEAPTNVTTTTVKDNAGEVPIMAVDKTKDVVKDAVQLYVSTLEATTITTISNNESDNVLSEIIPEPNNTENAVTTTVAAETKDVVKDAVQMNLSALEASTVTPVSNNESDNVLSEMIPVPEAENAVTATAAAETMDLVKNAVQMNVVSALEASTMTTVSNNEKEKVLSEMFPISEINNAENAVITTAATETKDVVKDTVQMNVSPLEATTFTTVSHDENANVMSEMIPIPEPNNAENAVISTAAPETKDFVKDAVQMNVSALEAITTTVVSDNGSINVLSEMIPVPKPETAVTATAAAETKEVVKDDTPINASAFEPANVVTTTSTNIVMKDSISGNALDGVISVPETDSIENGTADHEILLITSILKNATVNGNNTMSMAAVIGIKKTPEFFLNQTTDASDLNVVVAKLDGIANGEIVADVNFTAININDVSGEGQSEIQPINTGINIASNGAPVIHDVLNLDSSPEPEPLAESPDAGSSVYPPNDALNTIETREASHVIKKRFDENYPYASPIQRKTQSGSDGITPIVPRNVGSGEQLSDAIKEQVLREKEEVDKFLTEITNVHSGDDRAEAEAERQSFHETLDTVLPSWMVLGFGAAALVAMLAGGIYVMMMIRRTTANTTTVAIVENYKGECSNPGVPCACDGWRGRRPPTDHQTEPVDARHAVIPLKPVLPARNKCQGCKSKNYSDGRRYVDSVGETTYVYTRIPVPQSSPPMPRRVY